MKQFYTERDVEDLFKNGQSSLRLGDNIVLTDLAYEKARQLGMNLISGKAEASPVAPVRKVKSGAAARSAGGNATQPSPTSNNISTAQSELEQRIRSAVKARLGDQVDATLLDSIIQRVVRVTGVK